VQAATYTTGYSASILSFVAQQKGGDAPKSFSLQVLAVCSER
jgi:hypothetical protein